MLKDGDEGTCLLISVHLHREGMVVNVFQGGVKEHCLVSVALELVKVVSKVMQSIDSKVRHSM